jgi:hypothetical protein
MQDNRLDAIIARFQNLPGFNIHVITENGHASEPWYGVEQAGLLPEIVLDESNLAYQVQIVTAQIQKWGRLEALARRVWQVAERNYRVWRSAFYLKVLEDSEKKPTENAIQAMYRTDEKYQELQVAIERAEEATNAAHLVLEAFRAQKDVLKNHVYRSREDGAAQLAV